MQMSKAIKSIPWLTFEGNDRQQYMVTGKWHLENHERLLVLDFVANLEYCSWQQKGKTNFRIVISKKQRDFAVLFNGKIKTVKKTLRNIDFLYPASCYMNIDKCTEDMIHSITGQKSRNHQIETLDRWMRDIIEERRGAARTAAGELSDDAVDICPEELPEGLIDWIRREVLAHDNTMIYKKGGVRGTCALCGRTVRAFRNNKMAQYRFIKCPDCGEEVLCVLSGGAAWKADYVQNVMAVQQDPNGIVWFRQWHVKRDESARYDGGIEKYLVEIARYGIRGRKVGMWLKEAKDSTYIGRAFSYPLKSWRRNKKLYTYDGSYMFYPGGIDEAVANTILQYADLRGYYDSDLERKNIMKYAVEFARYPVMEFFWKAGYKKIITEKVNIVSKEYTNAILWKREKLSECIRFPLRMLKALPPEQWDMPGMQRMRNLCQRENLTDTERILLFHSGILADNIDSITKYAPAAKTLKYLKGQRRAIENNIDRKIEIESISDVARTYRDYLSECEQLRYDLTLKEVLFPKDLNAAHERTMQTVSFEKDRKLNEKLAAQVEKLSKLSWTSGDLLIRPAANSEELTFEGKMLNHCVAGYVKDMAEGKTAIFFIRYANAPEMPYYTLELQNKRVVQCRAKNNRPYEGDVQAFVEEWLKKVVAKGGRRRTRVRATV